MDIFIPLIVCLILLVLAFGLLIYSLCKVSARADRLWEKCRENEAAEFERVISEARK